MTISTHGAGRAASRRLLAAPRLLGPAALAAAALASAPLAAQDAPLAAPATLLLPNDDSLPIGTWAAFEANAAVVRVDDSSAVWFNPAGLARASSSSAAASASTLVQTKIDSDGFASPVSGSQLTPSQFAAVLTSLREKTGLTLGVGITRVASWDVRSDGLLFQDVAGGRRRLTFNETGTYIRTSYALAAAGTLGKAFRGGLGLSVESVETDASIAGTDAVTGPTSRAFTFRDNRENTTLLLRATLGVQADLGGGWGLGAVVRSPGLAVSRSGRYAGDFTLTEATSTTNVSFYDDAAKGEAHLPVEVVGGVAFTADRFSVEAKVRLFGSTGAHDLYASDTQAIATVVRPGQGTVTFPTAVPAVTTSRRSVVDLALGGSVDLGAARKVRLHAGLGTSRAPVPSGDPVFTQADLWSATLGVTTKVSSLALSLGFRYERGTIDEVRSQVLPTGEVIRSAATIQNLGLVFAFAYSPDGGAK